MADLAARQAAGLLVVIAVHGRGALFISLIDATAVHGVGVRLIGIVGEVPAVIAVDFLSASAPAFKSLRLVIPIFKIPFGCSSPEEIRDG